jgi:hypothetical protein
MQQNPRAWRPVTPLACVTLTLSALGNITPAQQSLLSVYGEDSPASPAAAEMFDALFGQPAFPTLTDGGSVTIDEPLFAEEGEKSAALSAADGSTTTAAASLPAAILPAGRNVLLADILRAPLIEDTTNLRLLGANCDVIILHEWHQAKLPIIRSGNPNTVILLYKDRGFALTDSQESVANYNDVSQNDSWFMHDAQGHHIFWDYNRDGRYDYASPRPENSAYQSYYYNHALTSIRAGDWDGLYIDDLWTKEEVYGMPDIVEYSTLDDLQGAMAQYLAYGHAGAQSLGLYIGGNVGWWRDPSSVDVRAGRRYLRQLDFAMQEKFFVNYSTHWYSGNDWFPEVTALVEDIRLTGHAVVCYARGPKTDIQSMLYGLCTYLCITDRDGRLAFAYFNSADSDRMPPFYPEYDLAEGLGAPLSDVQWHSGHRCGYRAFANGYVVVNPDSTTKTVRELANYYDVNGIRVPSSGAVFPPYSGMIFFKNYSLALSLAGQ